MCSSGDIHRELAVELLHSAGEIRSIARGGSMLPTIFPGDGLKIRKQRFEQAKAGDVVLAINRGHLCTHRVVREELRPGGRVLITRGDSLPFEDPDPVRKEDFLGSVEFVVRRDRRFCPEAGHGVVRSILRMLLQRSTSLRNSLLRVHFLLRRIIQRPNVRYEAKLSGDVA
ncbi:MAG: hypothetical protein ACRD8A_16880 [Candidatus Acidiferrales bacterium]